MDCGSWRRLRGLSLRSWRSLTGWIARGSRLRLRLRRSVLASLYGIGRGGFRLVLWRGGALQDVNLFTIFELVEMIAFPGRSVVHVKSVWAKLAGRFRDSPAAAAAPADSRSGDRLHGSMPARAGEGSFPVQAGRL